jgi:hypothetical protein
VQALCVLDRPAIANDPVAKLTFGDPERMADGGAHT